MNDDRAIKSLRQEYISHTGTQDYIYQCKVAIHQQTSTKQTPWASFARPSDRRLSPKLVPTFVDKECRVVNATDPQGRILGFLDRSRYYFFQVAPQLYSRGWVGPVSRLQTVLLNYT
jgi:hypothetical protein